MLGVIYITIANGCKSNSRGIIAMIREGGGKSVILPGFSHASLPSDRNRTTRVNTDGHRCQRSIRWTLNDGSPFGGIELCPVTWAEQELTAWIVLYRTSSMSTGRIECYKLAIAEVDKNARVAIRR